MQEGRKKGKQPPADSVDSSSGFFFFFELFLILIWGVFNSKISLYL